MPPHPQVFLLGRMGNALRALHLIIDKLGDIPRAIDFVRSQRDDELWEQLISWALSSPDTTGTGRQAARTHTPTASKPQPTGTPFIITVATKRRSGKNQER